MINSLTGETTSLELGCLSHHNDMRLRCTSTTIHKKHKQAPTQAKATTTKSLLIRAMACTFQRDVLCVQDSSHPMGAACQ
eukprot:m.367667 g.367667  ORF g.367667 m.367667 type:complete len:80 (+) comp41951_c0_seq1:128-367(+)